METVKILASREGKHSIDIQRNDAGLYRYFTFSDRYRLDRDFANPPHWTIESISGLYETAEAAEADAMAEFPWLSAL